eukprot:96855-Chlamydomonas_euryale.AAC.3
MDGSIAQAVDIGYGWTQPHGANNCQTSTQSHSRIHPGAPTQHIHPGCACTPQEPPPPRPAQQQDHTHA